MTIKKMITKNMKLLIKIMLKMLLTKDWNKFMVKVNQILNINPNRH